MDEGILHYVLLLIFNLNLHSIFLNNSYNVPKFVSVLLFSNSVIIPHWNTHNHLFKRKENFIKLCIMTLFASYKKILFCLASLIIVTSLNHNPVFLCHLIINMTIPNLLLRNTLHSWTQYGNYQTLFIKSVWTIVVYDFSLWKKNLNVNLQNQMHTVARSLYISRLWGFYIISCV